MYDLYTLKPEMTPEGVLKWLVCNKYGTTVASFTSQQRAEIYRLHLIRETSND